MTDVARLLKALRPQGEKNIKSVLTLHLNTLIQKQITCYQNHSSNITTKNVIRTRPNFSFFINQLFSLELLFITSDLDLLENMHIILIVFVYHNVEKMPL